MDNHLVLDLEPNVRDRLEQRARQHGLTLEEEARRLLAAGAGILDDDPTLPAGERIARQCADSGVGFLPCEVEELRGGGFLIPDFGE
ncbi:toxin-antitoxin system [Niveispirillum sp. SYP-B3756]|jgi:plasmid stability protein|uniref:FitA-like ribbon-helix-helix domain-containing protein n=1 Tax=Niveispirillum sp. SYP-B3756 TaxID=2662178 RepID=UPI0012924287|nr:toxin-antitoxin system [Niveispirillum sp. SYP-B3756]MQP67079.1 toxin-antitoxin system [Niveispirillum sp. SYP-B3756]